MHCKSYEVWQRYLEAVTTHCDSAMREEHSTWRYRCNAATLDAILSKSLEIDKCQGQKLIHAEHWSDNRVLTEINRSQMISSSPTSSRSTETEGTIQSASSATHSISSSWSSQTDAPNSTLTSPTTYSADSASTSSSPTSPTGNGNVDCLKCECGSSFSGSSKRSNLQRHRKSAKGHNNVMKYTCPEPGCDAKIGRSDNLKKHFQASHPLSEYPGLQRRGALKRRRDVQDEFSRERLLAGFI